MAARSSKKKKKVWFEQCGKKVSIPVSKKATRERIIKYAEEKGLNINIDALIIGKTKSRRIA